MSEPKNVDPNKIEKRAALEVEIAKQPQPASNGPSKADGEGKSK